MKTIKEGAKEYAEAVTATHREFATNSFKAGVDFAQEYIPIEEELPPSQKRVMVKVKFGTSGEPWTIVACYIPFMTVAVDDFLGEDYCDNGDYNEEDGTYYTPEGWYESNLYSDINYQVSDEVVSWRPIERK